MSSLDDAVAALVAERFGPAPVREGRRRSTPPPLPVDVEPRGLVRHIDDDLTTARRRQVLCEIPADDHDPHPADRTDAA